MDKNIKLIIACEAMKGELEHFSDTIDVDILWIQHSLHNEPRQLNMNIKEKVAEAEEKLDFGDTVLLFFGNCGGALEGISSKKLDLSYPDVADCIPIMLGSMEKFRQIHKLRPGTFYLNKAWIDSGQDPMGATQKYKETYGEVKGCKVANKMYQHYTHFALVDNGCYDLEDYRKHVMKTCEDFGKEFVEEKGTLDFVAAILENKCRMKMVKATDS